MSIKYFRAIVSYKVFKWLNNVYYHKKESRKWVFGIKKNDKELTKLKQYTNVLIERFVKVKGEKLLKNKRVYVPFFPTNIIEWDHITPLSKKESNKINNMQLLHGHCHKIKTSNDHKVM